MPVRYVTNQAYNRIETIKTNESTLKLIRTFDVYANKGLKLTTEQEQSKKFVLADTQKSMTALAYLYLQWTLNSTGITK